MVLTKTCNSKANANGYYRKPGATGGKLIRSVIALLREHQIQPPIHSDILIATSGGADSMALAHLMTHYGRRVGDIGKIRLLHINHRWRGKKSDEDEAFVRSAAESWGVPVLVRRLKPPKAKTGESLEEEARTARKKIYQQLASKGAVIFTAHHGDDLAETLLWRIFTGTQESHGGGIAVRMGSEIRPFLTTRKTELIQYLKEEHQQWREDATNFEGRFLRSKMRLELIPVITKLFPQATQHLIKAALAAQYSATEPEPGGALDTLGLVVSATGLRVRRAHWDLLRDRLYVNHAWTGEVHLPGGWKIRRVLTRAKRGRNNLRPTEQWIIERERIAKP